MKRFTHIDARTVEEAVSHLARYGEGACVIAGGTDLLGKMKERILPRYPEAIVNLKTIPGLDFIREENEVLRIGAMTRLQDVADHPIIQNRYAALSQAAGRTASPNLREMGTLAGNICQDIRCWYYRGADDRFPCLKKGGGRCYAIDGDNRYHSIFGGTVEEGCYAVHPSDTAPALIALNASIQTSKRTLDAEDFFAVGVCKTTVLESDEIVTEIRVPAPVVGTKSAFVKVAPRKSIDFAIVNCAARLTSSGGKAVAARICLNAVHVKPRRAVEAERSILGTIVNEEAAEAAGAAAVSKARPMTRNGYMVQIASTLVKRAILACA